MMISFSPRLSAAPLPDAWVDGDVLTIGGEVYDFGPLAEGDLLPMDAVGCPWLVSDVTREGGEVAMTLILPHGEAAPQETLFPVAASVYFGTVPAPPFNAVPGEVAS